jgi:hypothetical protein
MTGGPAPRPEEAKPSRRSGGKARTQDELLDEALEETFPASDPVSVYRL